MWKHHHSIGHLKCYEVKAGMVLTRRNVGGYPGPVLGPVTVTGTKECVGAKYCSHPRRCHISYEEMGYGIHPIYFEETKCTKCEHNIWKWNETWK